MVVIPASHVSFRGFVRIMIFIFQGIQSIHTLEAILVVFLLSQNNIASIVT